jgi:type VI secretion system protein ImpE
MNAEIETLLDDGQLDGAIAALNAQVRAKPADVGVRAQLAELLCWTGNLERADTILDAISTIDPSSAVGVALVRQLVRAEQARVQFYTEGRSPEFSTVPDEACKLELQAAIMLREGDEAGAAKLIEERDALAPARPGSMDGVAFDDFRDLDDINASHLEILTSTGKYYWAPLGAVASIQFRPPERRRDLLWRRANIVVIDGPEGEVFVPAIYHSPNASAQHRLGQPTSRAGKARRRAGSACAASSSAMTAAPSWSSATSSSRRRGLEAPAMAEAKTNVQLSLLDRLIDENPDSGRDAPRSRGQQLADLRNAVRRDLQALLNSHTRCISPPAALTELRRSLIEYGLKDFLSGYADGPLFRETFRKAIEETIRAFESRFVRVSVALQDDTDRTDRTLRFRIDAVMFAEPAPEPISFDSTLDPSDHSVSITKLLDA